MNQEKISPASLQKMGSSFQVSKVLSVAVELDIFSKINQGLTKIDGIAKSLHAHHRPIEMLLNACTALELLEQDGDDYKGRRAAVPQQSFRTVRERWR